MKLSYDPGGLTATFESLTEIQVLAVACSEIPERRHLRSSPPSPTSILGRIAFRFETSGPEERMIVHDPISAVALAAIYHLGHADIPQWRNYEPYLEMQAIARSMSAQAQSLPDAVDRSLWATPQPPAA
jgi:hypothetical protein